jgi:hypothetical protein
MPTDDERRQVIEEARAYIARCSEGVVTKTYVGDNGLTYTESAEIVPRGRSLSQPRMAAKATRVSHLSAADDETPKFDPDAWNNWCDQRADARVEAALTKGNLLHDVLAQTIGNVRSQLRDEIADATKELRAELDTLRSEVTLLRKQLEQEQSLRDLYKQLALRSGELARLRDELEGLRQEATPVMDYFRNGR